MFAPAHGSAQCETIADSGDDHPVLFDCEIVYQYLRLQLYDEISGDRLLPLHLIGIVMMLRELMSHREQYQFLLLDPVLKGLQLPGMLQCPGGTE